MAPFAQWNILNFPLNPGFLSVFCNRLVIFFVGCAALENEGST